MNSTLLKAMIAFVPACLLFVYSVRAFAKRPNMPVSLQLLGSGSFLVVVLTHVCVPAGFLLRYFLTRL
jgi:hypothetical protein